MPQIQQINLQQPERKTPLDTSLESFSARYMENKDRQRDSDALKSIYEQYQGDEQNILGQSKAIMSNPNIGPSAKVNAIDALHKFATYNKDLQKEAKAAIDTKKKEETARTALKESGATDQQMALYDAAPVGGKTKIVGDILESNQRSQKPAELGSDLKDYDTGLTPSERVKRQDQRYTTQTPLLNKNSTLIHGLENEGLSIGLLNELNESGLVGQGAHNLNINPKTGELLIPKAATPEEQLFVKTVNDFTVKAKDSFGARVTNFELDRFMQRLPTLANSEEGRRLILRQMSIINEINALEAKEIQKVFDQYGVRNIDYADAENIARRNIADQKEDLRKEYLNLEQLAKKEDAETIKNIHSKTQPGYVPMRRPDGVIRQFPEKNVPNLEEKGFKRV